jgi:uncharacterized phage-associated protein
MKLIGADYLLLLLYLNGKEPIEGAVKLTKMMFLFEKQIAPVLKEKGLESDKLPEFFAYNYGPFSKDIYQQLDLFESINFIQINDTYSDEELSSVDNMSENEFVDECYEGNVELKTENNYRVYRITDEGSGYVESELLPVIEEQHKILLEQFKKKITDMPIKKLLHYVYTKYPEYTDKSLIKEEVLKNGN